MIASIAYFLHSLLLLIVILVLWILKNYLHELLHKIKFKKYNIPCKIEIEINRETFLKGKAFRCNFSDVDRFKGLNNSNKAEIILSGLISNIFFLLLSIFLVFLTKSYWNQLFAYGALAAFTADLIANILFKGSDVWTFEQLRKGNLDKVLKTMEDNEEPF